MFTITIIVNCFNFSSLEHNTDAKKKYETLKIVLCNGKIDFFGIFIVLQNKLSVHGRKHKGDSNVWFAQSQEE